MDGSVKHPWESKDFAFQWLIIRVKSYKFHQPTSKDAAWTQYIVHCILDIAAPRQTYRTSEKRIASWITTENPMITMCIFLALIFFEFIIAVKRKRQELSWDSSSFLIIMQNNLIIVNNMT